MIKLLPSSLIYALFVACFVAGGWLVHRLEQSGEVYALNQRVRALGRLHDTDLAAQSARYEDELRRAKERVTVREVIRHVKDVRACDIAAADVRVLDARMQGVSTGADAGPGAAAAPVGISERQLVAALDDMAERFHTCRGVITEWNQRIKPSR